MMAMAAMTTSTATTMVQAGAQPQVQRQTPMTLADDAAHSDVTLLASG